MNKKDAIEALRQGKTLTHKYFSDNEWVKGAQRGRVYEYEDGIKHGFRDFWWIREGVEGWDEGWKVLDKP